MRMSKAAIVIISSMSAEALAIAYEQERMKSIRGLIPGKASDIFIIDGDGDPTPIEDEQTEITLDNVRYETIILDEAHFVPGFSADSLAELEGRRARVHRSPGVTPSLEPWGNNRKERRAWKSRSGEAKEGHKRLAYGYRNHRRSGKASLYRR